MEKTNYEKCLVLDSTYMPRSVIWTGRAFVIHLKGNAEIIAEHPESFGLVNPELDIKKPSIIKVHKYVNQPFHRVPLNRENIYKRDGYECVYCGKNRRRDLTLDHVLPKAKGGKDSWDNLVTACKSCNHEKSDMDLDEFVEMRMELGIDVGYPDPRRPHYLMLMKSVGKIPDEWKKFLFLDVKV